MKHILLIIFFIPLFANAQYSIIDISPNSGDTTFVKDGTDSCFSQGVFIGRNLKVFSVQLASVFGLNKVTIKTLDDFPTPVAGIITLVNNTAYFISGNIDIGTNRIVCGIKNSFIGTDRANDILTSTTTGTMFTCDGSAIVKAGLIFNDITIGAPNGTLFNFTSSAPNQLLGMINVTISSTSILGTLNNFQSITLQNVALTSGAVTTNGFTITGTNSNVRIRGCVFNNLAGTLFNFGTSVTGSIDINNNYILANATQTFLSGTTGGANVTVVGKVNDNIFSGAGSFLNTIGVNDVKWSFTNNTGVVNTTISGITAAMVGLGNVDNTSDANKPVSLATQTFLNAKQNTIITGTTGQYFRGDLSLSTFPTTTASFVNSTNKNFVTDANLTAIGNIIGINTGDNAVNTTYANDFRAANFVAGTNYLAPNGSAASLISFPILNQNTTGTSGGLSANIAESQVTNLVTDLAAKQATLVSATNIKTINGNTILGSGDLTIVGSPGFAAVTGQPTDNVNLATALNGKQATLVSNVTIKTVGGISLLGSGDVPTGGGPIRVFLPSDVINNNGVANSIADVTGLSFPVSANVTYKFRFVIVYSSAATTTGSRWSINGPATTHMSYISQYPLTATSITNNAALAGYNLPAASNASSLTTNNRCIIEGEIRPSAGGTVIARFASEITASAITAIASGRSYVEYQIIN